MNGKNTQRKFEVIVTNILGILTIPVFIWLLYALNAFTLKGEFYEVGESSIEIFVALAIIVIILLIFLLSLFLVFPSFIRKNEIWFRENKVSFFVYSALIVGFILAITDLLCNNMQNKDFWNNILVEAHGLFFDILLFGIILSLYERFSDKHKESKRFQEEIDDYSGWKEPEAMFRIVGNIKRLVKIGISSINLGNCFLKDAKLAELNLNGCRLTGAILENSDLSFSDLSNSKIIDVSFKNAMLIGVNFKNSQCDMTDFEGAFLGGANFMNVNISSCNFKNSKFNSATILENAKIDDKKWFENHVQIATNFDTMIKKYIVEDTPIKDNSGYDYYIIKRRIENEFL